MNMNVHSDSARKQQPQDFFLVMHWISSTRVPYDYIIGGTYFGNQFRRKIFPLLLNLMRGDYIHRSNYLYGFCCFHLLPRPLSLPSCGMKKCDH